MSINQNEAIKDLKVKVLEGFMQGAVDEAISLEKYKNLQEEKRLLITRTKQGDTSDETIDRWLQIEDESDALVAKIVYACAIRDSKMHHNMLRYTGIAPDIIELLNWVDVTFE